VGKTLDDRVVDVTQLIEQVKQPLIVKSKVTKLVSILLAENDLSFDDQGPAHGLLGSVQKTHSSQLPFQCRHMPSLFSYIEVAISPGW